MSNGDIVAYEVAESGQRVILTGHVESGGFGLKSGYVFPLAGNLAAVFSGQGEFARAVWFHDRTMTAAVARTLEALLVFRAAERWPGLAVRVLFGGHIRDDHGCWAMFNCVLVGPDGPRAKFKACAFRGPVPADVDAIATAAGRAIDGWESSDWSDTE